MKKFLSLLLAGTMLISTAACGGQEQAETSTNLPEPTASQPVEPSTSSQPIQTGTQSGQGNILIAYFSLWDNAPWEQNEVDTTTSASVVVDENGASGTTRYVAQMIQDVVGGDIHAIITTEPYSADFDAVVSENHSESSRTISSTVENMEQYDVVFIGYPVWATTLPQAVRTFLTGYDFSGKTVIPFCTHDGYGAGRSFSTVAELAVGAETLDGLALHAPEVPSSGDAVTEWLDGLNLPAAGSSDNSQQPQGETVIRITIGDQELDGVLYDSAMAHQFIAQLPQTITMTNYGGREVYGGIDQPITVEGEGQLRFDDGDITYCPSNNTAAIFYSQSDRPNLTMTVYPIGKVTSDLSIFPDLPSRVEITFELMKEAS
ncbi:MAG: cyclophilin-like fold protein [Ruminococcus flavefaciens]|nr:cyclophilin-like fold protein [Ruminococcus flavefaciens]